MDTLLPLDDNRNPMQGNLIKRGTADSGLIASGSIAFTAGENLTTEKKTASISLGKTLVHPDSLYLLVIDKLTEDTAGDLTIKTYNEVKVDGTNSRDVLHTTHTVEKIAGVATFRDFLVQGLFFGEENIKLGMNFATDSGAITVYYKIYQL